MPLFSRKSKSAIAAPVTQPHRGRPFDLMPPSFSPYAGSRLYYMLRQAVPLIDAAVMKTVRLTGGFDVRCADPAAQSYLDRVLRDVPVGGNRQAALLSGVAVKRVSTICYVISSFMAALSGIVLASMNQQAIAKAAAGYENDVLTAIVVGGTSLAGGEGSIQGALFGALLVGVLNNGMRLMGVPSTYHTLVKGVIIICAVAMDVYGKNKDSGLGRSLLKGMRRRTGKG